MSGQYETAEAYDFADDTTEMDVTEQKQLALQLMTEAFAEGELDGVDPDCLAQAALFTALKEFVGAYGEEAVGKFTDGLSKRISDGEFTVHRHG
jgi:hypothetical protein